MASLAGLRVLLAEDNPTNQMVAMQMLESLGADVVLAEDGVEAVERAGTGTFDVGLIDIEMPRLSGTDVIRRLRAGPPPHRDIPLIALTAYVMREHRAAINEAGADGVIAKPILSIDQLGADIMSFVEARNGREPAPSTAPAPSDAGREGALPEIDHEIYEQLATTIGAEGIADLLQKIEADVVEMQRKVKIGLEGKEPNVLRDASHILVSVAGSVGAVRLQKDAQCLNSAAHSGDTVLVESLGRVVLEKIDGLRDFIRSKLQG